MIFLSFCVIVFILLLCAYFTGDIGLFINWDSLVIVLVGTIVFSISISIGKFSSLLNGLKEIFLFRKCEDKNDEVKNIFFGMTIISTVIGICSTAQGITSSVLMGIDKPILETISIASFTTIYGILISFFLWFPVYIRHK